MEGESGNLLGIKLFQVLWQLKRLCRESQLLLDQRRAALCAGQRHNLQSRWPWLGDEKTPWAVQEGHAGKRELI